MLQFAWFDFCKIIQCMANGQKSMATEMYKV